VPSKKHIALLIGAVLLVVVLALLFSRFQIFQTQPRYAAVYLTTGDIYFGKLERFPSFQLSDAWFLGQDPQGGTSLQKFADAVWQPAGTIHLSRDQIVFWAPLDPVSPVVQAIEGRIPPQQIPSDSVPGIPDVQQDTEANETEPVPEDLQ